MFTGDTLRDPIWQSIGVIVSFILGVISAIISLVIYFKQRSYKEITWRVIENNPILITKNIGDFLEKKIEINYLTSPLLGASPRQQIKEIYSIELKVFNSGNNTIERGFYEKEPLIFEFTTPETKLLYIQLINKWPKELVVEMRKQSDEENKVRIEPVLLKKKSSFTFRILIDRFNDNNAIHASNQFDKFNVRRSNEKPGLLIRILIGAFDFVRIAALVICMIVSIILTYNIISNPNDHTTQHIIIILEILITYITILIVSKIIRNFLENQDKGYPQKEDKKSL